MNEVEIKKSMNWTGIKVFLRDISAKGCHQLPGEEISILIPEPFSTLRQDWIICVCMCVHTLVTYKMYGLTFSSHILLSLFYNCIKTTSRISMSKYINTRNSKTELWDSCGQRENQANLSLPAHLPRLHRAAPRRLSECHARPVSWSGQWCSATCLIREQWKQTNNGDLVKISKLWAVFLLTFSYRLRFSH